MTMNNTIKKLVTHDGSFHTDDIFAAATLSILLEKKGEHQYERDAEHGFEIISPEDLKGIPEDETLGRVVHLAITQKD